MSSRGRPTTRAKGLKNGFYIELKVKGSNKGTRIMRETHEQAMLALTQFQNKIVRYLGEVKDNYWMDGDNKGKKVKRQVKEINWSHKQAEKSGFPHFMADGSAVKTVALMLKSTSVLPQLFVVAEIG